MSRLLSFFLLIVLLSSAATAQQLVSVNYIGAKTQAQLAAEFSFPFMLFGAKYYRVTYTTPDVYGVLDTASALIAVPDDPSMIYPRLVYQHGTSSSRDNVPSNYTQPGGAEGGIPVFFAGMGFVTLAPDYLGLGDSRGVHPYVHAASEAWVAQDLLRALPDFTAQTGVHVNDQLFVTGYSQGGHASMALHRAVEQDAVQEFSMTAAAHLSGPYSIGDVMRDLILSDSVYYYPGYIPNTALSYQTVYGNLFDEAEDIFRQPYAAAIQQFVDGQLDMGDLNDLLIDLLIANEGSSRPTRMLQDSVRTAVLADPGHPINVALRDNDVYHWAPGAPTRIFYCQADDQVPYRNSLIARDTMLERGATSLSATDVNPAADHGACVVPALTQTILFFLPFQQIDVFVGTGVPELPKLLVYPNPVADVVTLDLPAGPAAIRITDLEGRLYWSAPKASKGAIRIDMAAWPDGVYLVDCQVGGQRQLVKLIRRNP